LNWIDHPLSEGSYYQESIPKDSIFIRHTSGYHRPDWVINSWGKDRTESTNKIRSGSAFVIGGKSEGISKERKFNGLIYKAFDPHMWAHHLFIKAKNNTFLNQKSIGIELCNYGELTKTSGGEFYTSTNIKIDAGSVTVLDNSFRGERYFHSYTDLQIESLYNLLIYLGDRFEINLKKGLSTNIQKIGVSKAFDLSEAAIQGSPGVWSHSNVRVDKISCYPHPDLIKTILSL
jgi:serine protease inhibitor